jgi:hypothetical protein
MNALEGWVQTCAPKLSNACQPPSSADRTVLQGTHLQPPEAVGAGGGRPALLWALHRCTQMHLKACCKHVHLCFQVHINPLVQHNDRAVLGVTHLQPPQAVGAGGRVAAGDGHAAVGVGLVGAVDWEGSRAHAGHAGWAAAAGGGLCGEGELRERALQALALV